MTAALINGLTTIPAQRIADLERVLARLHHSRLEDTRQIAAMNTRIEKKLPPHGWNMPALHLPKGSEEQEQQITDNIMEAYMGSYDEMIAARKSATDRTTAEIGDAQVAAFNRQHAIMQTVINANPALYTGIDVTQLKQLVRDQITAALAKAQMTADLKHAKAQIARRKKEEDRELAEQLAESQRLSGEASITKADLQTLMDLQYSKVEKQIKSSMSAPHNTSQSRRNNTSGRSADVGSNNDSSTKRSNKKQKGKPYQRHRHQSITHWGTGDKGGKGGKGGKQKHKKSGGSTSSKRYDHSICNPQPVPPFKSTVVNLSQKPLSIARQSVLGLGPMFRPTPRPLPDEKVTKTVRKFAQSIKTAAYFALNPIEKTDDPYNPKLYTPTGNTADPDSAALEHTLLQYEGVIERALEHTAVTPIPQWPSLREESTHSLGKHQRAAYTAIKIESKDGTGTDIALMADKDRAFVNVTVQQYMSMWKQHLSTAAYKQVEFSTIDWTEIVRKTRYLANTALEDGLITPSQHRYLVKDCTGNVRYPRGSVMVKTHKPINPSADPPAASRAYVDTVNYITSAWSRYLSVQLTPAREQIPNRVSDTRDFICKLLKHRFKQDCWLGTADIVDFYPNTKCQGEKKLLGSVYHQIWLDCALKPAD